MFLKNILPIITLSFGLSLASSLFSGELKIKSEMYEPYIESKIAWFNNVKNALTVTPLVLMSGMYFAEKQSPGSIEKQHILATGLLTGVCLLGITVVNCMKEDWVKTHSNKVISTFKQDVCTQFESKKAVEMERAHQDFSSIIINIFSEQQRREILPK